jgi:hypothetical protein
MKWLDKFILGRALTVLNKYDDDSDAPDVYDSRLHRQLNKIRNQLVSSHTLVSNNVTAIESDDAEFNHEQSMKFTVHSAHGGYIIELRTYNSKTDRHVQQLHLISDDADLSESIAKIMTMELLRR